MPALGSVAVGSVVYVGVSGVLMPFLVVHQGNPSTTYYDDSCAGTWLLMQDIYSLSNWSDTNNDYEKTIIHSTLNNAFYNSIDSNAQKSIIAAKIPYTKGAGSGGVVKTKANGLSTKIFMLSRSEVTTSSASEANKEGSILSYFNGAANSSRIAYYNGKATDWWVRTFSNSNTYTAFAVSKSGSLGSTATQCLSASKGVRPAMILYSDTEVNDNGVVGVSSLNGFANIGGAYKELTAGYANIGGTWHEILGAYKNISGTWKE